MKEDLEPDPYVVKRPRPGFVLATVAMMLVALGVVWAYPLLVKFAETLT